MEANVGTIVSRATTIHTLYGYTSATGTATFTLRVCTAPGTCANSSPAMACTFSGSSQICSTTSAAGVSVAAGDLLDYAISGTGVAASYSLSLGYN